MKKIILISIVLCIISFNVKSQISEGGIPPSFIHNLNTDIDRIVLNPKNLKYILSEEEKLQKTGYLPHIGCSIETDISIDNAGTWTELPDGSKIWQLQIKSPGALAQVVYYDKFHLPVGSKLFLYNEDKTQVIGAFTWKNNPPSGYFANELIYGDLVTLEYYEPAGIKDKAQIHIHNIGYIYRGVPIRKNTNWTEPSEPCEVNINCSPVGDPWQDAKRGVARSISNNPQWTRMVFGLVN